MNARGARQTLLIEFGYRGRAFHGLYPQPNLPTAGGTLRDLIERHLGWSVSGLAFSARTDAGVDAQQNFATLWFRPGPSWDSSALQAQFANSEDLWIRSIESVPRSMHARNCARSKHYRYVVRAGAPRDAANAEAPDQVWTIAPELDHALMDRAAQLLVGKHDFTAFRAAGCAAKVTTKTLERVDVTRDHNLVVIDVVGDAFLRKMVRIIAGTLAEIGAGLRPSSDIFKLLSVGQRRDAGLTAPARGLTLVSVELERPTASH